jgi:hypothetical protein
MSLSIKKKKVIFMLFFFSHSWSYLVLITNILLDIFSFFALCKHVPKNKFNINVSYKFDPTVEKRKQELTAVCDPATHRVSKRIIFFVFNFFFFIFCLLFFLSPPLS